MAKYHVLGIGYDYDYYSLATAKWTNYDIEFDFADSGIRVRCDTDITGFDDAALDGLIMYLGTDTDLTIDGVYAEINHKSRGPQNGLH